MPNKETPLWASISNDGGRFTVYYQMYDIYSSVHQEGYNLDSFKDCPDDLPVVRFDKAKYDDVCAWLRENHITVDGYTHPMSGWSHVSLEEYLDILGTYDIYHEPLAQVRKEFWNAKN
jgi:hypothetical protein